jgi:predicted HTH domain antitoxin
MQITIQIPDELGDRLASKWGDLERKLLELLAIEAYRELLISSGKVQSLLGMSTCLEVDAFLKAVGVNLLYDEAELAADRRTMEQLEQEGNFKK